MKKYLKFGNYIGLMANDSKEDFIELSDEMSELVEIARGDSKVVTLAFEVVDMTTDVSVEITKAINSNSYLSKKNAALVNETTNVKEKIKAMFKGEGK